jgi:imidazolonepropionase-like amidohydrolase
MTAPAPLLSTRSVLTLCLGVAASGAWPTTGAAQDVALTGATIHTATGEVVPNGTIVIRNGTIEAIGEGVSIPGDVPVVDVSGKTIIPGMMDNHSHIGFDIRDVNERSTTFTTCSAPTSAIGTTRSTEA